MSSVLDNIKKNDNQFSFISTFFDLVGNKEFKEAEISTMYTKTESAETSIWRSLSAVAQQLGSTFYSNTLNFIDNIANIDLCKVNQLQSMMNQLGVNYTVFNDIKFMPLDIQNLIDIFSIKREYLTSYVKMDNDFVGDNLSGVVRKYTDPGFLDQEMPSRMVNEDEYLSTAMSSLVLSCNAYRAEYEKVDQSLTSYWTGQLSCQTTIDDQKFDNYMLSVYWSVLNSKLCATYNNKACTYIYQDLSNNIMLSDFALPNNSEEQIKSYKLLHNISRKFNEQNEVDKYENGEVDLSDYTEHQQSVLIMEINRRAEALSAEEPKTRYKFYRQREVKDYAEFIQNEYNVMQQLCATTDSSLPGQYYIANTPYALDNSYIELYNYTTGELSTLSAYKLFQYNYDSIDGHAKLNGIKINNDIVVKIAQTLVNITKAIREVREQLKMQCQKYFMRGTKLLLNNVICEYLRSNIANTLKDTSCVMSSYVFNQDLNNVDIIEYIDPTNYYNISVDTDNLLKGSIQSDLSTLNAPYWESVGSLKAIGAFDDTDIFAQLPTLDAQNFIFNDESMSAFYCGILNNKFAIQNNDLSTQAEQLQDFLKKLFILGADNTFLSNDVFHTFDSYTAKLDYENTVANNNDKLLSISYDFKELSNFMSAAILPSMVLQLDQNTTLNRQIEDLSNLCELSAEYYILNAVKNLSSTLYQVRELTATMPLMSMISRLSSKYQLQNENKYEAYEYAIGTDSYYLQNEYEDLLSKYTAGYEDVSVKYTVVQSSEYIPDGFKQDNLTLCAQISSLCVSLSALELTAQRKAVRDVANLSASIDNIGKLSAQIELEIILETLSSQFDEELGYKLAQISVLRNSDNFKSREKIFKNYSGTDNAETPYYYMSNARHPSYMLHPYLSNYVENEEYDYAIANIANIAVNEAKQQVLKKLSDIIDEDGYLINIWKNPLNTNTDYVSKYESAAHQTVSGKESEVIGYDGLFHPQALYDFLNLRDDQFTIDLRKYNLSAFNGDVFLQGNFIDALKGVECINIYTGIRQNVQWNTWYEHLDLTLEERMHIVEQLEAFRNEIQLLAQNQGFDIYKYGLDAYNNAYILVKGSIGSDFRNKDEDEQRQAAGYLWMRIKDHPIAFPAFVYKVVDNTVPDSVADVQAYDKPIDAASQNQQICLPTFNTSLANICNTDYTEFEMHDLPTTDRDDDKYKTPLIHDFMFSNNGNVLIINGYIETDAQKHKSSYPVLVNIEQMFDVNVNKTLYYHAKVNQAAPIYSVIEEKRLCADLSGLTFETYFYDDERIGVLYSKIDSQKVEGVNAYDNSISVFGSYYNILDNSEKRKELQTLHVADVRTQSEKLENVCIDCHGDIMTVAYLDSLPADLSNYCRIPVDLTSFADKDSTLSTHIYDYDTEMCNMSIATKEYEISKRMFLEKKVKAYTKYTDCGFFGLHGIGSDGDITNQLGHTYLALHEIENRGIYKFQILSEQTPIENMIDFRRTLIARPYENYNLTGNWKDFTTSQGTTFTALTYFKGHYYEPMNASSTSSLADYTSLSSNVNVYDPYEFKRLLHGNYPVLKADELFLSAAANMNTDANDGYPYICQTTISTFEQPWGQTNTRARRNTTNAKLKAPVSYGNCVMQIFPDADISTFPMLSVSWGKDSTGKIQLDFNPMFNALSGDGSSAHRTELSVNTFNSMNLFLNLNYPGEAGYLRIYEYPLSGNFKQLATYYIKNISDSKPKFMLSANYDVDKQYPGFELHWGNQDEDPSVPPSYVGQLVAENVEVIKIVNEDVNIVSKSK